MAKSTTVRFSKFIVRLGDGASPVEVFAAPCGFNSKSFNRSKSFGETTVPNCPDDDAPAWTERDVQSMSATISGEGVLAKQAVARWEAAFAAEVSTNCEVELIYPDGDSELYTGAFHLESFEISGTRGERVTANITLQSDGPVDYARTVVTP